MILRTMPKRHELHETKRDGRGTQRTARDAHWSWERTPAASLPSQKDDHARSTEQRIWLSDATYSIPPERSASRCDACACECVRAHVCTSARITSGNRRSKGG